MGPDVATAFRLFASSCVCVELRLYESSLAAVSQAARLLAFISIPPMRVIKAQINSAVSRRAAE